MTKFDWIEVEPGQWQGSPSPHRFDAPVLDVWQSSTDSVWFCNVQHHSWDDSFSGAKRIAERWYNNWIATHPVPRVAKERAAVVTFLRTRGGIAADLADCIERGEHRREEGA